MQVGSVSAKILRDRSSSGEDGGTETGSARGAVREVCTCGWWYAGSPVASSKPVTGYRRLKGHKAIPQLVAALRARDQQLGLVTDAEKVA